MWDEWMPVVRLPITIDQFQQLPRNAAYKYEFFGGEAVLSPRPRSFHCLLDLRPMEADPDVIVRPLSPDEIPRLGKLFAGAFQSVQPFESLDPATIDEAARSCLEQTRTGGDGPLVPSACFIARLRDFECDAGAILITILPDGDASQNDSYYWRESPPPDLIEHRLGRPHLTWIFVAPMASGQGVGSTLLAASVHELLRLGYTTLCSTFLDGNHSSMLWHWRCGFRLLPGPFSKRELNRRRRFRTNS
jgi:GNAT superfamily N-acetyltransferase